MPPRKRPNTDQVYWRFQYKGRTYEKSMETSSKREAQSRGMEWEVAEKRRIDADEAPLLYPSLVVLRDLDVKRMLTEGRHAGYITRGVVNNYKQLIAYWPGDVRAVTDASLLAYVDHRRAAGARRQTIAKELVCLKRGFRLAHFAGPANWPKLARDEKNEKQANKEHSRPAWQGLLMGLEGEAWDIMAFALLTGLRREELYRARPEDVLFVDGWTVIKVREKVKRKNDLRRRVVLGPMAAEIAGRLPFKSDRKKAHMAACVGNKTGNMTLRDARAAFATAADRAGDSRATDLAMGHSGIPARYQHSDYERLDAVASAVQTWLLTGTVAGGVDSSVQSVKRQVLDMTTHLWWVEWESNPRPTD